MPFLPTSGVIFVKPDKPIERQGAIILPATSHKQTTGTVFRSASDLCFPGDRVMYARFWPIHVDGREYLAIHEKDLVAVDSQPMLTEGEKLAAGLLDEPAAEAPPERGVTNAGA